MVRFIERKENSRYQKQRGRGHRELLFKGHTVSVWGDRKALERNGWGEWLYKL